MTSTTVNDVAKKAKSPKSRGDWERKPLVLQVRGDLAWKAWLERAARFGRRSVASFVDEAVAKLARESGFTEEPPER